MSIDAIRANTPAAVASATTSFKSSPDRQSGLTVVPQSNRSGTPFPVTDVRASNNANPNSNERVTESQVSDAVEKLSKFVSTIRPEISFSVDQSSGTRVVKILDSQSKEVLRQIPSEEAIQLAQALDKLQGLFVRDKA